LQIEKAQLKDAMDGKIIMNELPLPDKGLTIAYDQIGSGPPMVFVHGLTYDRRMWIPVIEKLSYTHACINIDLPGHGKSSDAPSYNLLTVAGYIHDFVEKLVIAKPFVVGHSIGGIIATIYASMYATAGLVTSDQILRPTEFIERIQVLREQLKNPKAFPRIWRSIESKLGIGLIPEERRMFVLEASNPRQEIVLGYWGLASNESPATPAEIERQIAAAASRIKSPFTAIFGEDVDLEYRDWLSKYAPHCRIVVFPNAGHFPHLVNPERFAEEIRTHMQTTA
jgi:pimeloyl-ACP methyl ester carboxylesterase